MADLDKQRCMPYDEFKKTHRKNLDPRVERQGIFWGTIYREDEEDNEEEKKEDKTWQSEDTSDDEELEEGEVRTVLSFPLGLILEERYPGFVLPSLHIVKDGITEGGNAARDGQLLPGMVLVEVCGVTVIATCIDKVHELIDEKKSHGKLSLLWRMPTSFEKKFDSKSC
jgi:hypothetical protein